jgi:hypothetical protein
MHLVLLSQKNFGVKQALIGDEPAVIWELENRRLTSAGICELVTVGMLSFQHRHPVLCPSDIFCSLI